MTPDGATTAPLGASRLARAARLAAVIGTGLARRPRGDDTAARCRWMRGMSERLLAAAGGRVVVRGAIPATGLIAANHLGYLDILAIGREVPAVFVAKSEVAAWPVFGLLARTAGTLFVERDRKSVVDQAVGAVRGLLVAGHPVVLFPEGTSSGGDRVLPLRSSLLAAAVQAAVPVTPCALRYDLPGGDAAQTLAYWGDMTFGPHLWNLLAAPEFVVTVTFGVPVSPGLDRKALAARLHREISALLAE